MTKTLIALSFSLLTFTAVAQAQESFQTPSKNIACALYDNVLRCDIKEITAALPPRPKDCELDWGHAFEMGVKGAASRACAGDTIAEPNAPILDYGKTWERGGFRCSSEMTGLTCTNPDKRGWTLKKAEQKVF